MTLGEFSSILSLRFYHTGLLCVAVGGGGAFLYRRRARGEVCPAVVPPERSERAHKGTVGRAGHCLITRSAPLQTGGGTWPAKPKPTRSEGLATMLPRGVLAPIRGGCGRAVVRLLATSLVVFQLLFVLWLQPTAPLDH